MKTILSLLTAIVLLTVCSLSDAVATAPVPARARWRLALRALLNPLVPNIATAGSAAFTLTVNGSGFVNGSVIYWNSTAHTTTVHDQWTTDYVNLGCRRRHCRQCARFCKEPGRNGNL